GRATDGGALRVARTVRRGAGAGLRRVADAARWAAHGPRGNEGVGRADVGGPVAELGDVARPDGRPADAAALHVGRTGRARAGAGLGRIAAAGRGTADRARRCERVGRTVVADAVAALRRLPGTGGRGTHGRS